MMIWQQLPKLYRKTLSALAPSWQPEQSLPCEFDDCDCDARRRDIQREEARQLVCQRFF